MTQLTSKLKRFEQKPRNAADHVGAQLRAIHLFHQWMTMGAFLKRGANKV
jgi:hypothetical protein